MTKIYLTTAQWNMIIEVLKETNEKQYKYLAIQIDQQIRLQDDLETFRGILKTQGFKI